MTRKEGKKRGYEITYQVSIKSYSFPKKDRTFLSLWHARAIENCTYIVSFSRSLSFFPFVLNAAKIPDFTRLLFQKTPGGFALLEHSPRILVHQDAAIVYKCKKGWLRFRWRLEDGKADKTRDWWFTIAAPRRASPCPTCRIGKCGARACLVIEEFVFSFAEFTLLRKSHDFRVSVRVELPSSPLSPPSSLPSWITQHHRFDSSLISRILVENFCWDTVGISEFLYFFSRLDRGNVTFFFFFSKPRRDK